MTAEEDRASNYRTAAKRRKAWSKANEKRLAGDRAAAKALDDKTKALRWFEDFGVPRGDLRR